MEIEKSGREIKSVLEKILSCRKEKEPVEVVLGEDGPKETVETEKKEEQDVEDPKKKQEIIAGVESGKTKTSQKLCA